MNPVQGSTSRERPKSAPLLRVKNSKRTSKCESILFYSTRKTQKMDRIGAPGGRFEIFHPFVPKHQKIEGGEKIFEKSHSRKKRGPVWIFSTSILSQNSLVSPGIVCYAEKKEKLFWFSSLGQQVQFGALKFCRTLGRTILVTSGVSEKKH